METIIVAFLVLLVVVILFIFIKRSKQPSQDNNQSIILLQQQVESLRTDVRSNLQHINEQVNQQLSMILQQIQSQTSAVGNRLDNAARVIGEVQKNLGELGKATEDIKELGKNITELEKLLQAPKLRGGLGELLLEDLLKQVLPSGNYKMQYRFKSGQLVDAVIYTSDRMVPIDSKFPLENFRKMINAENDSQKKSYQKVFINDVKKHIDTIASKYILPDEGTFPFALMYIPAENIYYEVIIKDEQTQNGGIYGYAISRKVVPVSPNSFYAYLQVIALGLKGLQIERSAKEIINILSRLQGDWKRVCESFNTLGGHLENAKKKYDEAEKLLSNFGNRLENVADRSLSSEGKNLLSE